MKFEIDELLKRDKLDLGIVGLKDESLEDVGSLPTPISSRPRSSRTCRRRLMPPDGG